MNLTIFIFMLFTFQAIYWLVGWRAAKNLNTKEDYFLAGKSVKLFPLMMTFFATYVGGGLVLGSAEEAVKFGWPVIFYPLGHTLGFILLGLGIGRKLSEFKVTTIAQIFEVVYRSMMLRRVASMLSMISLFMILVAQIIASDKFLVSLGFKNPVLFITFWAIIIIYTTRGGLKAVISTDVVQGLFFASALLLCFVLVLFSAPSGMMYSFPQMDDLAQISPKLSGWLLMPMLVVVIEQDMGQRCFAGESSKIVSRASLLAGIFTVIICAIPVFLGSLASAMNIQVPQGGSVLMEVVAQLTNPWITALLGCSILAAIISTATSLINAIGSNLSNDFKLTYFKSTNAVLVARGITWVISIAAIFFAFYFDNVVDLLIQSYELSISCLFIPIFIALFKKEGNFSAAVISMLCGALGFFLFRLYPVYLPKEFASILLSLLGFCMGEVVAKFRMKVSQQLS